MRSSALRPAFAEGGRRPSVERPVMRVTSYPKGRYRLRGLTTAAFLTAWMWTAWWIWDVYLPRLEISAMFSYFASASMASRNASAGHAGPPVDVGAAVLVRTGWFAVMCLTGTVMLVAAAGGLAGARWGRRTLAA